MIAQGVLDDFAASEMPLGGNWSGPSGSLVVEGGRWCSWSVVLKPKGGDVAEPEFIKDGTTYYAVTERLKVWAHLMLVRDRLADPRNWYGGGWFNEDGGMCLANTLRHVASGRADYPQAMSGGSAGGPYAGEAERFVASWVRANHRRSPTIPALNDVSASDPLVRYRMVMHAVNECIKLVEPPRQLPSADADAAAPVECRRGRGRLRHPRRRERRRSRPPSRLWEAWAQDLLARGFEFSEEMEARFRLLDEEQSRGAELAVRDESARAGERVEV